MKSTRQQEPALPPQAARRGFSLMELLLVVVILGIISAVIVPRISVSTDTAKDSVQAAQISQLNRLIETYYSDVGSWPTSLDDLIPAYLPDGTPAPPLGGTYGLDAGTHRVTHTP